MREWRPHLVWKSSVIQLWELECAATEVLDLVLGTSGKVSDCYVRNCAEGVMYSGGRLVLPW